MKLLSRFDLFKYAILAFPLAFAGLPIYVHSPDYYATEFGQSLASIGILLLVLRLIDAVQDPLIGQLSDKYHQHRRIIFSIGLIMLSIGFYMIFQPRTDYILTWFGVSVFICTTGFSIATINLQAVGGLWHMESKERTRVSSWREGLGLIGLLVASITPAILANQFSSQIAFQLMSLILGVGLGVSAFIFFKWFESAELDVPRTDKIFGFLSILRDKWMKKFSIIFIISSFASAIPGVLVLFFVRDYLQLEQFTGLFLFLYFVAGASAMPIWQKISHYVGKPKAWMFSMVLAVITFIWAFGLNQGDMISFAIICILSGSALGADLAIPPAMMADHIAHTKTQNLVTRYYSISTFLSKLALALATGITLPLLAILGYQAGESAGASVLSFAYALIPCGLKIIAAFLLFLNLNQFNEGEYHEKNTDSNGVHHVA